MAAAFDGAPGRHLHQCRKHGRFPFRRRRRSPGDGHQECTKKNDALDRMCFIFGNLGLSHALRILTPQSSGYFEDQNTPAIQVQTLLLEGPRFLRVDFFFVPPPVSLEAQHRESSFSFELFLCRVGFLRSQKFLETHVFHDGMRFGGKNSGETAFHTLQRNLRPELSNSHTGC